ncbi:MAG: Sec-independent protein translocase protein TatB [Bdellovibrio sp.]|jgi:sec-independent protein translocase protein TatB
MFGLGFSEILVLGIIALIVIGPEDLPKVARKIGRFMNELKRGGESFKKEFEQSTISMQDHLRIDPFVKPTVGTEKKIEAADETPEVKRE